MQLISASSKNKLSLIPNTIFFSALIILASVLPFSEYAISVSQFTIAGAWLMQLNFKQKISRLYLNKIFWVLIGLAIIHLIGILYTDANNLQYALKDIRIKIPLLLLPLLFASSKPLSKKQFLDILKFFIASVFVATIYALGIKLGLWGTETTDARKTSVFISHIRFALMICFSIFILLYFIYSKQIEISKKVKALYLFLIFWFCYILFFIPFLTGAVIFPLCLIIIYFLFFFNKRNTLQKLLSISFLLVIPIFFVFYFSKLSRQIHLEKPDKIENLETHTALGNTYTHEPTNSHAENGNRVWNYVCWPELEEEWHKRSKINLDGTDLKNQQIRITLVRFLASKGLRKDASGISNLSNEEITAIENGKANVNLLKGSTLHNRLYQIAWEYHMYQNHLNPSGHSISMRVEYLKTASHIIKDSFWIGIGTGNIVEAYEKAYIELGSKLEPRFQRRTHNQYITFLICFGVIGLTYFIFSLFYPVLVYPNQFKKLYVVFILIVALSMLTEDTIETQVGVTFFAFFNSLFLFLAPKKENS